MKIKYFEDTDTLFIQLREEQSTNIEEFNEDLMLELDVSNRVVSMTVEHYKKEMKNNEAI